MKHYTGRSTNIKKVRHIGDDDAAVPTQDALNMKGYTLVVCMKKMMRERLIRHVILRSWKKSRRLEKQSTRSNTRYLVLFQYCSFSTTLEATALGGSAQDLFRVKTSTTKSG